MGDIGFFIAGHPPLPNATRGWHWGKRAKEAKSWHDATVWSARAAMAESSWPGQFEPFRIEVEFRYRMKRDRDRDNLVASLKPVIDGLKTARVIKDDSPHWMPEAPTVTEALSRTGATGIYVKLTTLCGCGNHA